MRLEIRSAVVEEASEEGVVVVVVEALTMIGEEESHKTAGGVHEVVALLVDALSGLDIALWDIKGKKLVVPIWQLLGGKVLENFKVYGWVGGDEPKDTYNAAWMRKQQGFTAIKTNATGM
ncbi:hypothetical protein H0H93_010338 [Arthromyces matolae]|nr:hypothetical protein H0H93_010338 [Arthromyces matolae]